MRQAALCLFSLFVSTAALAGAAEFKSDWASVNDGVWAGPAYWANPLQDWRVRDGRLECIAAEPDRNVQLLTYQVAPESTLRMRVDFEDFAVDGWAGFRFAHHGLFDEYRHNAIYGRGIDAGFDRNGVLFIDDSRRPLRSLRAGSLELTLTPDGGRQRATLTLRDPDGVTIGTVTAEFPAAEVHGNLALVCHATKRGKRGAVAAAFRHWRVAGENLRGGPAQQWGPILWSQYTLSRGVLKLSAQFPPIGKDDAHAARLEVQSGGGWQAAGEASIDDAARVALFRVANWDDTKDTRYRVVYRYGDTEYHHGGIIRKDPKDKPEITVAGFTGNKDYGFPNREIVHNVGRLDPDLLFFSGDQIYETVAGYGMTRQPVDVATLDYLRKWFLFGWSFGDLMRDRPTVALPDDHDVYQGNVWGDGGRAAQKFEDGGYVMPPAWVNMVQRTQTAHLPDAWDPEPLKQGIKSYYTGMLWGGISFAILEDRKFKSGPNQFKGQADTSNATLLGDAQLDFLREWAKDWRGAVMKATLSQTVFAQCHTHAANMEKPLTHDRDANGWPPEGRDRALREIRKAFAFMYAGDNHLPTVVHHGIDTWEDAGISFTVPSIAAGFPRSWLPQRAGMARQPGYPAYAKQRFAAPDAPAYIGRYESAWGHPLTMLAAADPKVILGHKETPPGDIQVLDEKSSGFGFVRFEKARREIVIECYRILADLDKPDSAQFAGWPVVIGQELNYYRDAVAWLPEIVVTGMTDPVVQVVDESNGETVYTLRINGARYQPKVFAPGRYTVIVGDQDEQTRKLTGLQAGNKDTAGVVEVAFPRAASASGR